MKIYAAKVPDVVNSQKHELISMLDSDRRDKVQRIKNQKEQVRSIYAGLLLRYAFLEEGYTEKDWNKVQVLRGEYGKPVLKGIPDFQYSLSHSGEWVICGTHYEEIGVDIQQMRPYRLEMANRFYHTTESRFLCQIDDENLRKRHFYCMWAAKESYVKLTGRGIGAGISDYLTEENYRLVTDCEEHKTAFMKIYDTIPEYIVSACSLSNTFPEQLTVVTL